MPFGMAMIMAVRFGVKASYSPAQLKLGRAEYRATISAKRTEVHTAIGYPHLSEGGGP